MENYNNYLLKLKKLDLIPRNSNIYYDPFQVIDLSHIKEGDHVGVPVRISEDRKAICTNAQITNTITIGNTGSGKTSNITQTYLYMNILAGNSMIVVDTKGDEYKATYKLAKKQGYVVKVLNLIDKTHSHSYNPLYIPYKLIHSDDKSNIELGNELLAEFCESLKEKQVKDVFWENASASFINGLVKILSDYGTLDQMNITNLVRLYYDSKEKFGGSNYLKEFVNSFDNMAIKSLLSTYIEAPNDTRGSIDSVAAEKINRFSRNESLMNLLSSDDMDIESLSDPHKKMIYYILISDTSDLDNIIVSTFLSQVISVLEKKAYKEISGSLKKKVLFLLEEFPQYKINNFGNIVSTSRSRNIEFLLVIQSFEQLVSRYDKEEAEIIKNNCMLWIYLYGKSIKTLETLSKLSGMKISINKGIKSSQIRYSIDDLLTINHNDAIIYYDRKKAFETHYTPYYKLDISISKPVTSVIYPSSKHIQIKPFLIQEIVKEKKRKKLLAMMNNQDEEEIEIEKTIKVPNPPYDIFNQNDMDLDIDDLVDKINKEIDRLEKEGKISE